MHRGRIILPLLLIFGVASAVNNKDTRNEADFAKDNTKCHGLPNGNNMQTTTNKIPGQDENCKLGKVPDFHQIDSDNDNTTDLCCFEPTEVCKADVADGKDYVRIANSDRYSACSQNEDCPKAAGFDVVCDQKAFVCCTKPLPVANCPTTNQPVGLGALCNDNSDCLSGDATACLKTNTPAKHCCGFPDDYKCPGDVNPLSENFVVKTSNCDPAFSYLFNHPTRGALCCPYLVPKTFKTNKHYLTTDANKVKNCTSHSDCGKNMFCDKSWRKFGPDPKNVVTTDKKHCYNSPSCGGVVELASPLGVQTCAQKSDCSSEAFCEAYGNNPNITGANFCCKFECPKDPPANAPQLLKRNSTAYSEYGCEQQECSLKPKTDTAPEMQGACFKVSDVYGVQLSNYGNKGRCCFYESTVPTCSLGTPMLRNGTTIDCHDDTPCEINRNGRCNLKTKKCCTGAKMCTDGQTHLESQPSCSGECKGDGLKCEQGHCCPMTGNNGAATKYIKTNMNCTDSSNECGHNLMFCEFGKCSHFGLENLTDKKSGKLRATTDACSKQKPCPPEGGRTYVCIYEASGRDGKCYLHPMQHAAAHERKEANPALRNAAIGCAVASLVFGLMAIVFFLKYRSRHLLDHRKTKKENNKDKKDKKKDTKTSSKDTKTE